MQYYQIAQISYSGLLLLIQVIFLCIIRRRNQIQSQVFQEPQSVKQQDLLAQKEMKSSIIMSSKIRKSFQLIRQDDPPTLTRGFNQNHQQNDAMATEQKILQNKIESPNSTIFQIQCPKMKSQIDNPESQRDPLEKLIGQQSQLYEKQDIMIQITYYIERIGFQQGLILLLWNFDLNFYIFIPLSLFAGVILRMQEKLGYKMIQMIVLILIHGLIILETYLIITNEYETICYLIVFGSETLFSGISLILHKKCQ